MLLIAILTVMAGFVSAAWCEEKTAAIGKGTISLSGDLDLSFAMLDMDEKKLPEGDYEADSFGINVGMGYFFIDNLETGLSVGFESGKTDYDVNGKSTSEQTILNVGPFIYYHLPVTENFFLVFGGGFGFSSYNDEIKLRRTDEDGPYESNSKKEGDGFYYGINLGVEHFLTDSVSIIGKLSYITMNIDGDITTYQDWETPPTGKTKFDQSTAQSGVSFGVRAYF